MPLPQRATAAVPGDPVKLFYCSGICNFGDELSPYIVEKITGRKVLSAGREEPALYAIGSLLNYDVLHGNNVVWGTGLISETSARILPKLFPFKRNIPILIQRLEKVSSEKSLITAVRGRLTRDVLTKAGHDCPDVYGDPGILLREFFCPSEESALRRGLSFTIRRTSSFPTKPAQNKASGKSLWFVRRLGQWKPSSQRSVSAERLFPRHFTA